MRVCFVCCMSQLFSVLPFDHKSPHLTTASHYCITITLISPPPPIQETSLRCPLVRGLSCFLFFPLYQVNVCRRVAPSQPLATSKRPDAKIRHPSPDPRSRLLQVRQSSSSTQTRQRRPPEDTQLEKVVVRTAPSIPGAGQPFYDRAL